MRIILILLPLIIFIGCFGPDHEQAASDQYLMSIERWRQERINGLTQPRSWTTLAGLFWLNDGVQRFGSSTDNEIVFPGQAPASMGIWELTNDSVQLTPAQGVDIFIEDSRVFAGGQVQTDRDPNPDMLNWESLYWTVIQRGERFGLRLWDTAHYARSELKTIPHYAVDPQFRLEASFVPSDSGQTLMVDNIIGLTVPVVVAGTVQGAYGDKSFNLLAFDSGPNQLFLIFADMTTDFETYSGGRYMYVPRDDDEGTIILDFNKAYNPPCAFTDFATCLLPPKENFIPFEVRAGEKIYHAHK